MENKGHYATRCARPCPSWLSSTTPVVVAGSMRRFLNQELKDRRHLSDSDVSSSELL